MYEKDYIQCFAASNRFNSISFFSISLLEGYYETRLLTNFVLFCKLITNEYFSLEIFLDSFCYQPCSFKIRLGGGYFVI